MRLGSLNRLIFYYLVTYQEGFIGLHQTEQLISAAVSGPPTVCRIEARPRANQATDTDAPETARQLGIAGLIVCHSKRLLFLQSASGAADPDRLARQPSAAPVTGYTTNAARVFADHTTDVTLFLDQTRLVAQKPAHTAYPPNADRPKRTITSQRSNVPRLSFSGLFRS